jgi:hypothetical protein
LFPHQFDCAKRGELPTGDRLECETPLGLFPAQAGYSHAASGKCDLDCRFESQRRIKVDTFRQFKRASIDVPVARLARAVRLRVKAENHSGRRKDMRAADGRKVR